jgi:DNA-binding winged helix-turn-helix (wHTH) protein
MGAMLRFGLFEVDLDSFELRKQGLKLKLAEQPFRVLAVLLERPGQVVSREELRDKLWGNDTFVDFDQSLNKAINRLRETLDDSAENSRFIETVPKRGYRFIAPVHNARGGAPSVPERMPVVAPSGAGRMGTREKVAWALAAVLAMGCSLFVFLRSRQRVDPVPLVRTALLPPPGTSFAPYGFALSPDGTRLAFVALDQDGKTELWIRALAARDAQRVQGTAGASFPFWSQDNQHIGFFAGRKLKALDCTTGAVRVLADAAPGLGGTWNRDGVILYQPAIAGPVYRIGAEGGAPAPVTTVATESKQGHCFPYFLPDGRHFLFYAFRSSKADSISDGIYIGELGSSRVTPLSPDIAGTVVYSGGHLLYNRRQSLVAQSYLAESHRLSGPFVPLAEQELDSHPVHHAGGFTGSLNGTVVYQSTLDRSAKLLWFSASGQPLGKLSDEAWQGPSFSPDGRFVAVISDDARNAKFAVRVHDLARGLSARLTEAGDNFQPIWSPDGKLVTYAANGLSSLFQVPADGSAQPKLLRKGGFLVHWHWSRDGHLAFGTLKDGLPILEIYSDKDGSVKQLGPGVEGQFSPDGKWIAYIGQGGAVGGGGIEVQSFEGSGKRIPISGPGGAQPRWSRDGRRLFYLTPDRKMMAVDFDPTTGTAGLATILFQTRIAALNLSGFQYDVAADGRFLIYAFPAGDSSPLTVISGWKRQ